MLDRLEERGRGPRVTHVAQPGEAVDPVQQVGVPLIRAESLDEQPPAVVGGRHERPRALRVHRGRGDRADRQARGPQRRGDPFRSQPPVGHAEHDQRARSGGDSRGEREDQFHGHGGARDQSRRARGEQREPRGCAPWPVQPRRQRHRDRDRPREQGGTGERRAGHPRAAPDAGRHARRVLIPGQVQDGRDEERGRRPGRRQAGQQAEPVASQPRAHDPGSGGDEGHLDESDEESPGRVRSQPGHRGCTRAKQRAPSRRHRGERAGEQHSPGDQADDVPWLTVASGGKQPPALRAPARVTGSGPGDRGPGDRSRGPGDRGRVFAAPIGIGVLIYRVRVHDDLCFPSAPCPSARCRPSVPCGSVRCRSARCRGAAAARDRAAAGPRRRPPRVPCHRRCI